MGNGIVKQIDRSAHIGDSGIALIHRRVSGMGFVWHERKTDAGIDGEIELRDAHTGEVANRILLVQSKASDNDFPGENDRHFHYMCRARDVDYWMQADVPVLLVCSHPRRDEAWWVDAKAWFANPAHRSSGRVDFNKDTQQFDASAAPALLTLTDPHGDAHTPGAVSRTERLFSNLLPVEVPVTLYTARTDLRAPREVFEAQRETGDPVRRDWILRAGKVCSWLPPEETALQAAVVGPTDVAPVSAWADSSDPAQRRAFVWLLNQALKQDVSQDCDWSHDRRKVFFRATPDLQPRKIMSTTGRQRLVFNPKQKKDGSGLSYCQHAALGWQFVRADGQWLCELVPTYHYTRDGYRESLFADEYLSGIKRKEKNLAVLGATRMWAAYLHGDSRELLDERDTLLDYGTLLTFTVDRGVDDRTWTDAQSKDAEDAASDEADDLALF